MKGRRFQSVWPTVRRRGGLARIMGSQPDEISEHLRIGILLQAAIVLAHRILFLHRVLVQLESREE